MRTLFYVILFVYFNVLLINVNGYSQWVFQTSNTNRHFYGLDVINVNTGYASGQLGTLRKTTNGGANWITLTSPVIDDFTNVSFINADTGLFVGPPGQILYTSDGGLSFNIRSHSGNTMGAVHFVSANTAYAVGDAIIKSTDGGLSWNVIRSGTLSQYQGVFFLDENIGTVVGRPGLILTTSNGGSTWQQRLMMLPIQFGDSTLLDVKYVNPLVGFACGNNGIFMKTTNSGVNWTYYSTGAINYLTGLSFLDLNTGYCAGNGGRIIKSTDGGISWIQQTSPTITPLDYIEFANFNTGWIVGFNGTILYTNNGGVTFVSPVGNEVPHSYDLFQNYPNPFNPTATIRYDLPQNVKVNIKVYDLLGRQVKQLVDEFKQAGSYSVNFDGTNLASGVYFYRIEAGKFIESKKMVQVK